MSKPLGQMNYMQANIALCYMCNNDPATLRNMREIVIPALERAGYKKPVAAFYKRFPA